MSQNSERSLNHFAFYRFTEASWGLDEGQRSDFHQGWLADLRRTARMTYIYQVFPGEPHADVLVWSALPLEDRASTAEFFKSYACAVNPYRHLVQPSHILWGFTAQSTYTKTRSMQELDPFSEDRKPYLVVYPFVKTKEWYLLSRDARQGMMNEHIRMGKQYPDIKQLLLYSFGMQDQEFVVVYETDDLTLFSELVRELRSTEGRRYTERDTPLHTAVHHPAEETLALWSPR